MGAFVLGVLVGWLAEWLFFTFWIKGRSTGEFADCTALKNEVSRKNTEISALKSELESTKRSLSDVTRENSNKKEKSVTVAKSTTASKSTAKKPAIKQTAKKPESSTKPFTKKSGSATKPAPQKPVAKAAVKKASPKKGTTKKPTSEKAVPKKTATKKVAVKKTAKKLKRSDELTKLSGIGPSMASTLNELGIDTFKKLADMDDDILRDMLEASGARLNNNKEAMDTWNEQAALADKGDMEGLKKLQKSLKK